MKPSELKSLMKECMREVLREEGLITGGIAENKQRKLQHKFNENMLPHRQKSAQPPEAKGKLVQEMQKKGYVAGGFDPFKGTAPLTENTAAGGPMEPPNGGVELDNISDLIGNSNAILAALKGGKK